jgi:hypothetical protein
MDAGNNEMVKEMLKDLHTGKVYRIIKIEHGIVVLEDVEGTGPRFINTTSLGVFFTRVEKERPQV